MAIVLDELITSWETSAVIFDLDGTLIDNNDFHLRSWKQYLKNIGKEVSEEEYLRHINGRTNKDAVEYIYGRKMDASESMKYTLEKEAIYREMFRPYIKPLPGLIELLKILAEKDIDMAIATSGIPPNIDYMFEHIPIREFFQTVVNATHIREGKPNPEIYLTTARKLQVDPRHCMVFEDAVVGVQAAQAAGMKVIAVTTTHTPEQLSAADLLIKDYTDLLKTSVK